jgi:hypothetical protein
MKRFLILTLIALLLAGCSRGAENTDPEVDAAELVLTAAAGTAEALGISLDPTETPSPSETPTATPEPLPNYMVEVIVTAEQLNLRSGPGTFFEIIRPVNQGERAITLETTPDGNWVKVAANAGGKTVQGWLAATYLDLSALESELPVADWPEEQTIYGKVIDDSRVGIDDVRVAAILQTDQGEIRGEGTSLESGDFAIYTPPDLIGPFMVEVVALNCGSRITEFLSDGSCLALDHFPLVWQESVSLPLASGIEFVYEEGIAFLEGKVAYLDGNGASEILVRATRQTDGAQSEFVTPVGGEFRLPLGAGTWSVVAVRFESDGTPLVGETRTYQVTNRGQTFEPLTIPYNEIVAQ